MNRQPQFTRWSQVDDARLRKMAEQRLTNQTIADALGRTQNAIFRRRHVLRILRPCIVDDRTIHEIATRYERGLTNRVIARILGIEPRIVTYAVRRSGAIYPPTTLRLFKPRLHDDDLLRLRSEGIGIKSIGRELGISHRSVAERHTTLDRYADALEMSADRRRAA